MSLIFRRFSMFSLMALTLLATAQINAQPTTNEIPASRLHRLPPGFFEPTLRVPFVPPTGVDIVNPAEFCRADAMIISWTSWHAIELLEMTRVVAEDDRVICIYSSASEYADAFQGMTDFGVNMTNVHFLETAAATVWIRDYGPFCAYDDGQLAISDFRYGTGGDWDAIPIAIAEDAGLPWYRTNLTHTGGNHLTDGNGMGFFTTNLTQGNSSWSQAQIEEEMKAYLGLESLVVFGTMEGDMTGHCDMFVKLLNDTLFVVGEYEDPAHAMGNDAAFLDGLAAMLDNLVNLDGRDFEVRRIPMLPINSSFPYNRTYTNSLILNDKVLVPIYGTEMDRDALDVYAECMPRHEIVGINCEELIPYLGAIHCVTSTLHDANPLTILHEPLLVAEAGDSPVLDCRLNPRFTDREVELHYVPENGAEATVTAEFDGGVWRAQLPTLEGDFQYWFTARVFTEALTMEASLPVDAPTQVFMVEVETTTGTGPLSASAPSLRAWPNPCNPRTLLAFTLAEDAVVDLEVYDLSGRRQRALVMDQPLGRGVHEFAWSGQDDVGRALPSGVYLARLRAGDASSTRRVTLVR